MGLKQSFDVVVVIGKVVVVVAVAVAVAVGAGHSIATESCIGAWHSETTTVLLWVELLEGAAREEEEEEEEAGHMRAETEVTLLSNLVTNANRHKTESTQVIFFFVATFFLTLWPLAFFFSVDVSLCAPFVDLLHNKALTSSHI